MLAYPKANHFPLFYLIGLIEYIIRIKVLTTDIAKLKQVLRPLSLSGTIKCLILPTSIQEFQ